MNTRLLRVCAILLLAGLITTADAANGVLKKRTSLRTQPMGSSAPLRMLQSGETVEILDKDSAARYYHVETSEDDLTGWALKSAIDITPGDGGGAPPPPVPDGTISSDWEKPAPLTVPYESQTEGTCAATGDGGDALTNTRKNRTDQLPAPHDVAWTAIAGLSFPRPLSRDRTRWTADQAAQISAFEGVALRTTGFLTNRVKLEDESGESTNCHFTDAADVDWHIYVVEHLNDPIGKAVIVETTPRVRLSHTWDRAVLGRWVGTDKPVRISGFLLLDQEHLNVVGTQRGTIWEIHPITKIEVCPSTTCAEGDWVDLDRLH